MKKLFDWIVIVTLRDGGQKRFDFPTKAAAERFAEASRREGYEATIQRTRL